MIKLASILTLALSAQMAVADLMLYTDRPAGSVNAIVDKFSADTNETVIVITDSFENIKNRLEFEADQPVADLVFVKDLVYMADLESKNIFAPISNPEITEAVEPYMQSPNKNWVGLTYRARTIVYNTLKFAPGEIKNYSDLTFTDAQWAGREPLLCLRKSKDAYNIGLLGFFIETMGYDNAKNMVNAWMNNLAREPYSDDRSMIDAIVTGNCDVAVVNTYYLAGKLFENPAIPVGIAFADQDGIGTHTNGTGIGVVATSTNKAMAEKFILSALDPEVQRALSDEHLDFPARIGVKPSDKVPNWPAFKKASTNWKLIGDRASEAKQLATEVGY